MTRSINEVISTYTSQMSADDRQLLVEQHLEPDPHKIGPAEVRLRSTGAPVWAIIGHLPAVAGDVNQVAHDYEVPVEAVIAAIVYYQQHKDIIDWRLGQNQGEPVRLE